MLREEYLPGIDEEAIQSVEHPGADGNISEVWYRRREKWIPLEDTEFLYGPKLRIHEIVCRTHPDREHSVAAVSHTPTDI